MDSLIKQLTNYVWKPLGEAVRGVEVVMVVVVLDAITSADLEAFRGEDYKPWLFGVGTAAIVAGAAYIKGRIKPRP